MSTIKITDLPAINTINANTANTILVGVDLPTNITGKMTLTTLAAGLYSNNTLAVGDNYTLVPNAIAQFTGNSATYIQVNMENQTSTGSGDFVVTADDGTDSNHFIDLGLNGSAYYDANYSALSAHDGYLYISSTGTNKGNLTIGTTNSTGKVNFVVGGLETGNIVGYVDSSGIWSGSINSVVSANSSSANSVINTRISSNVATLRGEISSNVVTLNGSISTNIATQNTFTQAAFNKANNALANTSGTFNGDLQILGNVSVYSIATSNITSFISSITPATNAVVEIVGSIGGVQQTPSNDGYMLHVTGKQYVPTRIVVDSFSATGNAYSLIAGRSARGSASVPTATQNNDVMLRISGNGWRTTGFAPLGSSRIDFVATENYTDTAHGSKILFYNIPNGSNTMQEIASFNGNIVHFSGYVNAEKGSIYTPRTFAGAQTAITIDFANNALIRANVSADYAVSFTNFLEGKQVEVWVTNTSGTNRTFTHGCSALNSTTNATTYTHLGTSTVVAKYMCFGGDAANVLVQVVHA